MKPKERQNRDALDNSWACLTCRAGATLVYLGEQDTAIIYDHIIEVYQGYAVSHDLRGGGPEFIIENHIALWTGVWTPRVKSIAHSAQFADHPSGFVMSDWNVGIPNGSTAWLGSLPRIS